jgi:tetrahydromethanopterin S-methyltransferase subunit F
MSDLSPPPGNSRTHDVYFYVAGGPRFLLRNPNHGLTVSDDAIVWTANGGAHAAPLGAITAIHLQTAALGNASNVIDQCRIEFTSGPAITVSNASSSGLPNDAQTPLYRDFVRDLHARLAARGSGATRFTAGMAPWRYKGLLITMIVAGLLFVIVPLGITVVTGDLHGLVIMAMGASLCWPVTRLMMNNAPRDYAPGALPDNLLS